MLDYINQTKSFLTILVNKMNDLISAITNGELLTSVNGLRQLEMEKLEKFKYSVS